MQNLEIVSQIVLKQRQHELIEEAKAERFLQEKKQEDVMRWMQRHVRRNRVR